QGEGRDVEAGADGRLLSGLDLGGGEWTAGLDEPGGRGGLEAKRLHGLAGDECPGVGGIEGQLPNGLDLRVGDPRTGSVPGVEDLEVREVAPRGNDVTRRIHLGGRDAVVV